MNYRKIYIVFFIGLISLSIQSNLFSQTVKASVNRDRIFIGEQIILKLSVENGKGGTSWFSFPDSVNHIQVVKRSKIDTVVKGNFTNYYQTISITSFDSGRWDFPPLSLPRINQSTSPISIEVLPVDVSKMQDYNDIKDIEEVKPGNNWLITAVIAAITLMSIAAVYWLLIRKKKVAKTETVLQGKLSPIEWAMAELNKLNGQNPQSPIEVKKYYSDLTNISRTFFNMQLQQRSLQQTTDEWMINLQPLQVDKEIKTAFFQILRLSDTVKFAKYLPPSNENQTSVLAIKQMLQKVSLLHSPIHSNFQPK
ncbi:hypothetical protein [Segetibacter koreensis]|uniref:hypothetical protein n=1 Tax=Segetibacter koreensis TaxID=398037 RepID=UPI00036CFD11|nr:hypothetical protein [Segetibacter koreensis]